MCAQAFHFMLNMSMEKKPPWPFGEGVWYGCLAVPYFRMGVHTIIGAGRFHFRGRDGIGWFTPAMAARQFVAAPGFVGGPPCRGGLIRAARLGIPHTRPVCPGAVSKPKLRQLKKRSLRLWRRARLRRPLGCYMAKPHGQLVSVSCTRCRASTPDLSTWWSSRALQGTLGPREASSREGLPA